MTPLWLLTRDGDPDGYAMARRHYSSKKNKRPKICEGVGGSMTDDPRIYKGNPPKKWEQVGPANFHIRWLGDSAVLEQVARRVFVKPGTVWVGANAYRIDGETVLVSLSFTDPTEDSEDEKWSLK